MPIPNVKCKICNHKFYAKPNWIKNGHGKYCSMNCKREAQKNGKVVKCFTCKKEVYKRKRALDLSKSGKYFCGKSCQTKWRNALYIGANHSNWKGGEYSYRSVLNRNKIKKVCKRCGTEEERVMAIHHLDGNRKNNKIKNLVWLCHNCHFLIHRYKEEKEKFMEVLV